MLTSNVRAAYHEVRRAVEELRGQGLDTKPDSVHPKAHGRPVEPLSSTRARPRGTHGNEFT